MVYVALLRGINVGGKNKISMPELKAAFEAQGMKQVTTYINSGNVVFTCEHEQMEQIASQLERAIERAFGLSIKVLIRAYSQMEQVIAALPAEWTNDTKMKCDVLFLWDEVDAPEVVGELKIVQGIDTVVYVPGALLWSVQREFVTRSGMQRIVGTELYRYATVRNCNTVRSIWRLMQQAI